MNIKFFFIFSIILLNQCMSYAQSIKIDHVIALVTDLDSAVAEYERQGFTIKPGRLHKNGLINAHIKFSNGSSLEIMSLQGKAKDETAKTYEDLLKRGKCGAYLALSGISTDKCIQKLENLNLDYQVIKIKSWTYVLLPDLPHIFFIEYHINQKNEKKFLQHANNCYKIQSIVIEGDERLIDLLHGFGLRTKRQDSESEFTNFITKTGKIVVIQEIENRERPIIRSIRFKSKDSSIDFYGFSLYH